jgi:Zn finger protein HypA/HybF involved in hydrogenase expression
MSKGYRDNHAARVKRGKVALDKKAERREPESKCSLCGRVCREQKLVAGLCPVCVGRGTA